MLSVARLREFLLDTDVHGVRWFDRRMSLPRRALWLLVFLASTGGLVAMVASRLLYFFSYPKSTETTLYGDWIPAPAVAVCPKHLVIDPAGTDWQHNISDIDKVLIAAVRLSHLELLQRTNDGNVQLNATLFDFIQNTNCSKSKYSVFELYMNQAKIIMCKLQPLLRNSRRNIMINFDREFIPFLKRYGMTLPQIHNCIVGSMKERATNCTGDMRQMMTSDGSCLVFDNVNGSAVQLSENDRLQISILANVKGDVNFCLYDHKDLPSPLYQTIQYTQKFNDSVTISRVHRQKLLSEPYNSKVCSSIRKSHCLHQCLRDNSDSCDYFYSRERKSGKPLCFPHELHSVYDLLSECEEVCDASCDKTSFMINAMDNSKPLQLLLRLGNPFTIWLQPGVAYEVYIQHPMYPMLSMLSEVGGAMGLLLGASLLTVYHFAEATLLFLGKYLFWDNFARRIINCNKSQTAIKHF